MGGGPAGGSLQYRIEAYAEAIRRGTGYDVKLLAEPGGAASIRRLVSGERDLVAGATTNVAGDALKGAPPFEKPMILKAISTEYPTPHMILIDKKLGFTKLSQIIQAKYPLKTSIGAPRQSPVVITKDIFKAYGITPEDITSWGGNPQEVFSGQAKMLFSDRVTDAFMNIDVVPYPFFVELGQAREVNLLSLDEDAVNKMVNAPGSYYYRFVTPAGTYDWQKEDVLSVAVINGVYARADMADEVAYNVVKALDEQHNYLVSAFPQYKVLNLENLAAIGKFVPLHPGAEKYYREKGAIK